MTSTARLSRPQLLRGGILGLVAASIAALWLVFPWCRDAAAQAIGVSVQPPAGWTEL